MNAQLQFKITNQTIDRVDEFHVVADSKNYLYASFEFFTDEWSGLTKTALFKRGEDGTVYEQLLDEYDSCLVPHESLAGDGTFLYVSVFAGDLITVNKARVRIQGSGYFEDAESSTEPTPSIYEQIITRLDGINSSLEDKVDKEDGKGLSTNDYSDEDKAIVEGITDALESKVDKVEGKVLSSNDYTDAEKQKLANIENGAEANVNPDWDSNSGKSQILHKPNTLEGYGIQSVPASMIVGIIGINNIHRAALERIVKVSDDTARFALTTDDVQNGDSVKVLSTGSLYAVIDDTKLNSEDGYEEYIAGTAANVPWSGVTDTPTSLEGYGIEDAYTKTQTDNLLNGKVNKVTGKDLSTNDYTTTEKNKLAGIEEGAEKNVNPDWNASSGDGEIFHKPTTIGGYGITDAYTKTQMDNLLNGKVDEENGKGLSTNDYTTNEKNKLAGIESLAQKNVKSDWNAVSGDAEILNKPDSLEDLGITEIPANMLTGIVPLENIPAGALDRLVHVSDDATRYALTKSQVQNGDTVQVDSTGIMYRVVNDDKLDQASGYQEYTAGRASSAPWSGITNKPTSISGYGITDSYTKTEINNKFTTSNGNIATEESSPSTHAYDVGDYLIYNNVLYKVKTAISIGSALVVGTNIESSNVAEALENVQPEMEFDNVPTENSDNLLTSGSIYTALQNVDNSEEMTLAQYEALTQQQKMDGTTRFITDVNNLPNYDEVGF